MNNYDKMKDLENAMEQITMQGSETEDMAQEVMQNEVEADTDVFESELTGLDTEMGMTETGMSETDMQGADTETESGMQGETDMQNETDMQMTETEPVTEAVAADAPAGNLTRAAYVIKIGDTLADICERYYGDLGRLDEICMLNGITDPNHVLPGQKIILP